MYADVERFRYATAERFLRVVEQQGSATLAAERNGAVDALLHQVRTLAADLLGPRGTPSVPDGAGGFTAGPGFAITAAAAADLFTIGAGHYWVGGRLAELTTDATYVIQPDYVPPLPPAAGRFLVYLDVWERHVGAAEDPRLLEPALGGPTSASRTRLVAQTKLHPVQGDPDPDDIRKDWPDTERELGRLSDGGLLAADVDRTSRDIGPCIVAPTAGYTGGENQLIRVEIHSGAPTPTFKWAFDNASVEHRVIAVDGTSVVLAGPPLDRRKGFEIGTRVELQSDDQVRNGVPGMLTTVVDVDADADDFTLLLAKAAPFERTGTDGRWALLRRWDHTDVDLVTVADTASEPERAADGARKLVEGRALLLVDGVQVTFATRPAPDTWTYRPGDYWTIPVRVATGDVIWPRDAGGASRSLPPEGVEHGFAPLAVFTVGGAAVDVREFFAPLAKPSP